MFIERDLAIELENAAKHYPVVAIMGPRQSGKTTLVRQVFAHKPYVNLEDISIRTVISDDPKQFFANYPDGAIIDEVQRFPDLLSYIQVNVDENKVLGKFILTGSHQLMLHQAISQSLAGRVSLLTLLPLTISELAQNKIDLNLDEYILNGFFPRVYIDQLEPTKAYRNYLQTYVERDVRQIINVKDLSRFQKFIKLCAGRIGSVLNRESLANEVGISTVTVVNWLSILEASFIIFRLEPYYENFGKRTIKSPKLYFTDIGLASYILGIENLTQLSRDPLRGALVENLIILELMKTRLNQGMDHNLYYYRDNNQNEVDVIYKSGNSLIPIEIKSAQTFVLSMLKSLNYYKNLVADRVLSSYLVYSGTMTQKLSNNIELINFKQASQIIIKNSN